MFDIVTTWYRKYFSHPQAVLLVLMLVISTIVIVFFGHMLAPVVAAVVIAYLLEGTVGQLQRRGFPRLLAVSIVFSLFLTVLVFVLLGLMPILSRQMTNFIQELPRMINEGRELLIRLPDAYPNLITTGQIDTVIGAIRSGISGLGQNVLSLSLALYPGNNYGVDLYRIGPGIGVFFPQRQRPNHRMVRRIFTRRSQNIRTSME